ncbi:MAG: polyhydroxyalkanoate synthesis regulator DNA-binding domain-containing protein [Candidatus Methylomirabilales bacterium]
MVNDTILIKKYSNRKLYDPSRSRYITLEEIADLIRAGKQVKVVDTTSHEDLTAITLAQIILEEERRRKHFIPVSFLHQLIQYGESFHHLFQRGLSSSLETFMTSQGESRKLWREWAVRGWMPPGRKPEEPHTSSGEERYRGDEASLKAELESLKQQLKHLEEKIQETEEGMQETA